MLPLSNIFKWCNHCVDAGVTVGESDLCSCMAHSRWMLSPVEGARSGRTSGPITCGSIIPRQSVSLPKPCTVLSCAYEVSPRCCAGSILNLVTKAGLDQGSTRPGAIALQRGRCAWSRWYPKQSFYPKQTLTVIPPTPESRCFEERATNRPRRRIMTNCATFWRCPVDYAQWRWSCSTIPRTEVRDLGERNPLNQRDSEE